MSHDAAKYMAELVESMFDEMAEMHNAIVKARNTVGELNNRYLASRQLLVALRAATRSVELTKHPDEINIVISATTERQPV